MRFARARLFLVPAPDDPDIASPSLQFVFGKARSFLRLHGVETITPMFYDIEAESEGYLGEFAIPLSRALEPGLRIIFMTWLDGRPGRKLRLRVGEAEAETRSTEEANAFLRRAQQLRETS
jgi:hypothetical protein